jgi:hypothetical protein
LNNGIAPSPRFAIRDLSADCPLVVSPVEPLLTQTHRRFSASPFRPLSDPSTVHCSRLQPATVWTIVRDCSLRLCGRQPATAHRICPNRDDFRAFLDTNAGNELPHTIETPCPGARHSCCTPMQSSLPAHRAKPAFLTGFVARRPRWLRLRGLRPRTPQSYSLQYVEESDRA